MFAFNTVITGSGSFIPDNIKTNQDFQNQDFYSEDHEKITVGTDEIVEKFKDITGIEERRYADDNMTTSQMATIAAQRAIADANLDPETLDQIIVAHNFGNIQKGSIQSDALPAISSRVKAALGIRNPNCVAYDILFGCPGWIQGMIQSDAYIKAGIAKKCLIIGAETLSRVIDKYDRDSMIFSDGAGATILEAIPANETNSGILSTAVQSHCVDEAYYLQFGQSYNPNIPNQTLYMKMKGRKVYEYAIKNVPLAMKACLDKANLKVTDVKKFFLHQANEKMDEGFVKALYKLVGLREVPAGIMPMSIHKFGNSSVATIPTLYDLVKHEKLGAHEIEGGDVILFASVGAGMNINAICYRV